jgi:hypothetical protein
MVTIHSRRESCPDAEQGRALRVTTGGKKQIIAET